MIGRNLTETSPREPGQQAVSYLLIGGLAFGLDVGVFALLNVRWGVPTLLANAAAISVAVIFSFLANARVTFGVDDRLGRRFVSFCVVAGVGLLLSSGILWLFSVRLGLAAVIVKVLSAPVVVAVQFLLNRRVTFAAGSVNQPAAADPFSSASTPTAWTGEDLSQSTPAPGCVAVIGGGFAGLSAAYELASLGHAVDVYEAAPSVGGLAGGFTLADGFPLERAYHFLYTTDEHMIEMVDRLGVTERLHFHPASIAAIVDGVAHPFTTATDLLRFSPLRLSDRVRTGLTALRLMAIRDWRPLARVTAYDWLCRVNGQRATDLVWKPLLVGKFDTSWDEVSMAWLWARIRVRQSSTVKGARGQHLGYFDGGFGIVVDRWVEEIERLGGRVHTSTPIRSMRERDGRPALQLTDDERTYDAVLMTGPHGVFAKLAAEHPQMSPAYAAQLTGVRYLAALVMIVSTSEPITDIYWHQIQDNASPFLVVVSLDSLIGTNATGGRHITYLGAYLPNDDPTLQRSDDELQAHWLGALRRLFPTFDVAEVRECHVFRFRNAQHIVGVDYQSRIPAARTPLNGYFLANFAQIYPDDRGTNFAVRDGIKAAQTIHGDLIAHRAAGSLPRL